METLSLFDIAAILVTVGAVFSYLNHRYVKLPGAIGLMLIALFLSLILVVLGNLGFGDLKTYAASFVGSIDFYQTLMHGMLSFLLFAGYLKRGPVDLANISSVSLYLQLSRCCPLAGAECRWVPPYWQPHQP